MYDVNSYSTYGSTTGLAAIGTTYMVMMLAIVVVAVVANWKIFTKAGKPGWAAIVPFYNLYVQFQIAGMNGWMFLLLLVPIVNIVVAIMLYVNLAKAFGKSGGFAVGLIFLNFIFMLILAFGSAEYVGNQK